MISNLGAKMPGKILRAATFFFGASANENLGAFPLRRDRWKYFRKKQTDIYGYFSIMVNVFVAAWRRKFLNTR